MTKRYLDKYYTPKGVVKKVLEIVEKDIMPLSEFKRIIEPSAGAGAFIKEIKHNNVIAYDIEPEYKGIIKADYLKQNLKRIEKSLVIGNPPFGTAGAMARNFIKKSLEHSDYVVFILPGDNYNKPTRVEGVKLYKSYLLPKLEYSGVKLRCCINIYVKGVEKNKKIKGVQIFYQEKGQVGEDKYLGIRDYDYRIISFGTARLMDKREKMKASEIKITFDKKVNFKPILEKFLKEKEKISISATSIKPNEIIKLIYDNYPELREN